MEAQQNQSREKPKEVHEIAASVDLTCHVGNSAENRLNFCVTVHLIRWRRIYITLASTNEILKPRLRLLPWVHKSFGLIKTFSQYSNLSLSNNHSNILIMVLRILLIHSGLVGLLAA